MEKFSFNKTAKENLLKFVRGIKKMQALQLIEPVEGHGKGKFLFKECGEEE